MLPRQVAEVAELEPQFPSVLIAPVVIEALELDEEVVELGVVAEDPHFPNADWQPVSQ